MEGRSEPEDMAALALEENVVLGFIVLLAAFTNIVDSHLPSFQIPTDSKCIIAALPNKKLHLIRDLQTSDLVPYFGEFRVRARGSKPFFPSPPFSASPKATP